jgi:hypothetical protein
LIGRLWTTCYISLASGCFGGYLKGDGGREKGRERERETEMLCSIYDLAND